MYRPPVVAAMIPVTPAPAPIFQKFCKPVKSLSFKNLGVYSTNPLKLTQKSPLRTLVDDENMLLEDVEQIDTNVFSVDIVDEDGRPTSYTIIVPEEPYGDH